MKKGLGRHMLYIMYIPTCTLVLPVCHECTHVLQMYYMIHVVHGQWPAACPGLGANFWPISNDLLWLISNEYTLAGPY